MKYCSNCGNELIDEAVVCPKCGCAAEGSVKKNSSLKSAAFAFMLVSIILVSLAVFLFPRKSLYFLWFWPYSPICLVVSLFWMIPMTVHYRKATKKHKKVGICFKICTLLFVSIISGILMLCDSE